MTLPVPLEILFAIVVVIKGVIDGLLRPLVEKFSWSTHVLRFGAWLLGAGLIVLSQVLPEKTFLLVLVGLTVGCGSNVLADFLSALAGKPPTNPQPLRSPFINKGK